MAEEKQEQKPCDICKGSGKCRACRGRGVVIKHSGTPTNRCIECQGTGDCPACKGKGVLSD